jgi:hydrogenase maturation protein HypF
VQVRHGAARAGRLPVVLTGGVFQNPIMAEGVLRALTPEFDVYLHADVPPGDGGIALGQVVIADAIARSSR